MAAEKASAPAELLVARFVESYQQFVDGVRAAVGERRQDLGADVWRDKVLPMLLEHNLQIIQAAGTYRAGDAAAIRALARRELTLGKDMDSYDLGFAGDEHKAQLIHLQELVVFAAYQVTQSGGAQAVTPTHAVPSARTAG